MNESTALVVAPRSEIVAPTDYDGLTLVVSPAEAKRRLQELQAFVAEVMVQGQDFGVIPGTEKPSLLQPGAQKLEEVYGFAHEFLDLQTTEDWIKPFFFYRKRCIIRRRRDGLYIGDGVGSCNSLEGRYAQRWVFGNEVPAGVDKSKLKKKTFHSNKTGRDFEKYCMPNEDIFSIVNTLEKMACKRALVAAIIGVTRSSGIFTQDVEDLPREVFGEADENRSWDKPKPVAKPTEPPLEHKAPPAAAAPAPKPEAKPAPAPKAAEPTRQTPAPTPPPPAAEDKPAPPPAQPPASAVAQWEQELRDSPTMREAGNRAGKAINQYGIDRTVVTAVYNEVTQQLRSKRGA